MRKPEFGATRCWPIADKAFLASDGTGCTERKIARVENDNQGSAMLGSGLRLGVISALVTVLSAPALAQLLTLPGPVTVNQPTRGAHQPAVAISNSGRSIAVWESTALGDDEYVMPREIRARIFDSAGKPLADEFAVSALPGRYFHPVVAAGVDGEFLVVWPDFDSQTLRARRVGGDGRLPGAEFTLETTGLNVYGNGLYGGVAAASGSQSGTYVVAYTTMDSDTRRQGIRARRLSPAGELIGTEIEIVLATPFGTEGFNGRFGTPDLAMDSREGFIAVWERIDGPSAQIYSRRFDDKDLPLTDGALVNTTDIDSSYYAFYDEQPAVAMNAQGDAVVAWALHKPLRKGLDHFDDQIEFRRYDSLGHALAGEQTAQGTQPFSGVAIQPDVAMAADGRFRLSWASYFPIAGSTALASKPMIELRTYQAGGSALAPSRQVSSSTLGGPNPRGALLSINAGGECVVAWTSHPDGLILLQDQYAGTLFLRHYPAC